MRKLNTSDVFKMARIIKKAKVAEAIEQIFTSSRENPIIIKEDDSEEVKSEKKREIERKKEAAGFRTIMTIFESCSTEELENMLYQFLGGITEKNPEDVSKQSLEATINDIKQIVKENNIADFFKQADQLTK